MVVGAVTSPWYVYMCKPQVMYINQYVSHYLRFNDAAFNIWIDDISCAPKLSLPHANRGFFGG